MNYNIDISVSNRALRVSSGAGEWSPSDVTTLAWYDAADTGTITDSAGSVSQWDDKSGNLNHLVQASAALQPVTNATTVNGLNVLDGDGADRMDATISVPADQDFHIYSVMNRNGGNCIYEFSGSVPTSLRLLDNSVAMGRQRGGSAFIGSTTGTVSATILNYTNHLNSVIGTSNEFNRFESGSTIATASVTASPTVGAFVGGDTFSLFTLFDDTTGGNAVSGYIAETVVVTNPNNRERFEGYLSWKWGIEANLPSGHPYKNMAPTA